MKKTTTFFVLIVLIRTCLCEWWVLSYPSLNTIKPVLSDHIQQDIFLAFQIGGCLLLHESSAESSCMSFLHYFHSAISNHLQACHLNE